MWRWWVSTHVSTALVLFDLGISLLRPSIFWADCWLFFLLPVNRKCPWQFWRTPIHLPQCRSNCICRCFLVGWFLLGFIGTVCGPLVFRGKRLLVTVLRTCILALTEQNSTAFWLLASHKLGCSRRIDTLACLLRRPGGICSSLLLRSVRHHNFSVGYFFSSVFWNVWLWNK